MMVDPITVPFLMKAVDFLFGEGSKILDERRERRKAKTEATTEITTSKASESRNIPSDTIITRDDALKQKISFAIATGVESEINHLLSLLEIYQKNYQLVRSQYVMWGDSLVPQVIVHNLTEAEDGIYNVSCKLENILSKVYGRKFISRL